MARKLKLYEREEDMTKWGILDHTFIENNKLQLKSDFAFAQKFMLAKEEESLEKIRMFMAFFTN